jgi:hypothetical protein
MSLSSASIGELKEVLRRTMALVYIDGVPVGSAFFVDHRTLITCNHVVSGYERCEVKPYERVERKAVVAFPYPEIDVAVLHSEAVIDEPAPPCVLLHPDATEGHCLVAGYPRIDGMEPGLEVFQMTSHWRNDPDGALLDVRLEAGKKITSGMSGGPVVDLATGAVTAVVRWSEDVNDALGGGTTPIRTALPLSPELKALANNPPAAVKQWRNVLGPENWAALDKEWELNARIDLRISGGRRQWRISMDQTQAAAHDLTIRDLGEDVAEALFRWAQRSRIRQKEEVELLGRLLASALIPPSVAEHLRTVENANVLVRMHFEPENNLADIPWELAAVPGRNDQFLAAETGFRLVRVGHGQCQYHPPAKDEHNITVVAVVAQPQWTFPDVTGEKRSDPYRWPAIDRISQSLTDAIQRNGFSLHADKTFVSPAWFDVRDEIESRSDDWRKDGGHWIFHYVGIGMMRRDGPQISFVDEDDVDEWEAVADVVETAARHGASLVVLELMLPPDGRNCDPVTPSSLGNVISHNLGAVVLTHLPVHPLQLKSFNQVFYQRLKSGEPVEVAVQRARNKLQGDKPVEDAACFGWFTLITGSRPGFTIVAEPSGSTSQADVTNIWNTAKARGSETGQDHGRDPDDFGG